MKKICIIGLGNMGKAILDVLSAEKSFEVTGCGREDEVNEKLQNCDLFIIAVKPQNFVEFADKINVALENKIAVSIMAGISIEKIQQLLKMKKVVRTLPNLPLKVAAALTIWNASDGLNEGEKSFIKELLKVFGEEVELLEESDINMIGALCGCGPAYFAYLGEKIEDLAAKFGLDREAAEKLAKQTFVGTAELLKESDWSLKKLRESVTSKGGITEAAIKSFEENGFGEIFSKGIDAAIKRTGELNG